MKGAFACWNQRIAPVFDVAREIRGIEVESGRVVDDFRQALPEEASWQKARRLHELGVDILICGAISRPMHEFIAARGIKVQSFIAGNLEQIVQAWLNGSLDQAQFAMPGCGRGCRRRRRGHFNQG